MVQQYISPKIFRHNFEFIPFQMFVNAKVCDRFIVVGISLGVKPLFHKVCRRQLGFWHFLNPYDRIEVLEFDIIPYLHELKNGFLLRDLDALLQSSTKNTNIILDHLEYLEKADPGIVESIKEKFKYKVLTLCRFQ